MKNSPLILILLAGAALAASPDNVRQAVRSLSQRAADGDSGALYHLARLHDVGYDSIPVDTARSTALYRESAMRGYGPARNYLGFRYFRGEGVTQNVDSALYWLHLAAEDGDPGAANNLGYLFASGEFMEKDYGKAREWFRKAADAGLHTAEAQLADLYRQGLGGETDTIGAVRLYNRAIEGGLRDAQFKLADLLKDWSANGDAYAMAMLGVAYAKGSGVPYNHTLANEYFLQAALLGDPSAAFIIAEMLEIFPDAMTTPPLSSLLEEALMSEKIPSEMRTPSYWYDKATSGGITEANSAFSRLTPR